MQSRPARRARQQRAIPRIAQPAALKTRHPAPGARHPASFPGERLNGRFFAFYARKAAAEKQIFKIWNFLLTNAAGVDRIIAITYF